MSSTDENIELIELRSPSSAKSYIKSKLKLTDNKISSSPKPSPIHRVLKENDEKPNKTPPPKPPRKYVRMHSKTSTEISSDSQEDSTDIKEYTESVRSSKLESSSYREKFKERFKHVKRQAGKSVSRAGTFKSSVDKIRTLRKSINIIKRENDVIDSELRAYENNKFCYDSESFVTSAEAYNFFCGDQNNEKNENIEPEKDSLNKSTEVLIEITDGEEFKFSSPSNLQFNRKVSENELFWQPSRKPLEVLQKIDTDEPRFLAEEGLYVKEKPTIANSHINIIEQRLLGANDKKWFDCEGRLDLLEPPKYDVYYKPYQQRNNSQLQTLYVKAYTDPSALEKLSYEANILDVSIFEIRFAHHPLFSAEHVFAQKLSSLFDEYKKIESESKLDRISKRLDAIRHAKKNAYAGKTVSKFCDEIKQLRELQFKEGKHLRTLLKLILQTWKTVKKIRRTNQFSNTPTQLVITKIKCNYSQEKEEWDRKIEIVTKEILEEMEKEYENQVAKYVQELEFWKSQEEENLKKPKKPIRDIEPDIVNQEVREAFTESFKPPGEPFVYFDINYDHEITLKVDNVKEKLRRSVVNSTKIYLRVLCDKIEVCKSKAIPLSDQFNCFVEEYFSILLTTVPESIVFEIYEQSNTLPKRKLGDVKVRMPKKTVFANHNEMLDLNFNKDEIVHYKHDGVGSGIELANICADYSHSNEILYTSGAITSKVEWDVRSLNRKAQEEDQNFDEEVQNEDGTLDIDKLVAWANKTKPDPEDPKHSVLYEYIQDYGQHFNNIEPTKKNFFRKDPEMSRFEFCEMKDLEIDLRFQLLRLRNQNEPEFVGMVIPNNSKEIPENVLDDYKRRIAEEQLDLMLDEDSCDDQINGKRVQGRKYLKQVYTKVFQKCRNTQNNLVYEDVVNEKLIPRIEALTRNILSNIISWIQLQPTKNIFSSLTTKKSTVKIGDLNAPIKIKVDVRSATNVPPRNNIQQSGKTETSVCSFVVATYQNTSLRTSNVEGENPIWNQELILPLDSSNTDYLSPSSMSGCIVVTLFDEVTVKVRQEYVKTRCWLGSVEIPISSVANIVKMEGPFKLQKPAVLLGYENSDKGQETYLFLRICLEPNIPKLTQCMDELETTELPYLKRYVLSWNEKYNSEYPHRKFSALAIDLNGKTTCVTRYIKPLEPPRLNNDRFVVTPDQCAQYIAMIPFTDTNKFYQNVWLTTEQLLKFMVGSIVDHAIALVCYLTSLNAESWLLLGYGLPHGATAYVLVRENSRDSENLHHYIYDLVNGKKYNILDPYSPLQKVFCVINGHNVWANVQRTEKIELTRFDFSIKMDWCQLFNQQNPAPTHSTQTKLNYIDTPDIQQLELKIDRKIRKKISQSRTHEKTTWNYNVSKMFRSEISKFENRNMSMRKNSNIFLDTFEISSTHYTNGYLLNLPYTNVSTIIATVMSTDAHLYQGLNTEFSLAVQIYSYPNHVLSVWICLAVLNAK
ncbi:hypothetical protein FQR65_LT10662 [Abscondita terminalis]|nr:hypothetical protein FQR65_LT10662 [Abscondita terminalis]